jgi:flavin-dependent dehydrogenase
MFDAIVAGAGPAGAVAARELSLRGRRILLADGAASRCERKIGETLSGQGAQLLARLGLPPPEGDGAHERVGGLVAAWASDAFVKRDFLSEVGGASWRLDRPLFDSALRAAALRAGAEYADCHVADVSRTSGAWRVELGSGAVAEARWIIDATGRRSFVARRCGARRKRDARLVAIYAVAPEAPAFQIERSLIESAPDGWWFAARLKSGAALAGFHTDPVTAASIGTRPGIWRAAFARTRSIAPAVGDVSFELPLPPLDASGGALEPVYGEGWIACGDAAMSFDPLAGHGIAAAIDTGARVADAVERALGRASPFVLADYARRLAHIRSLYLDALVRVYASQPRWRDGRFWPSAVYAQRNRAQDRA